MNNSGTQDSTVVDIGRAMPSKQQFYQPELDLLRFFAFLMVFVAHTVNLPHFNWVFQAGGYGVCLFFLLSAYLIAELLMREMKRVELVDLVGLRVHGGYSLSRIARPLWRVRMVPRAR